MVGVAGGAFVLRRAAPKHYFELMQEDGPLEWATAWLLLIGAAGFAWQAAAQRGSRRVAPLVLALACLIVTGEEISWGQRLIGFAPTEFFLQRNAQQETNLHNLAPSDLRQQAVALALAGFGIVLPAVLALARIRRLAERVGFPSPLPVAPLFVGALGLQLLYPLPFTGEIVEALAAAAFAILGTSWAASRIGASANAGRLGVLALAASLGTTSAMLATHRTADPERIVAAADEVEALAVDLLSSAKSLGAAPTRCGVHTRMHTLATSQIGGTLSFSRFEAQTEASGDPERGTTFIDPWGSSYWVRDYCDGDSRSVFVYSFGANRRRESSGVAVQGDDIGAYLVRPAPR